MTIEGQDLETNSDVSSESSSETPSSESQNTSETHEAVSKPKEESSPFHEHPRFKELVEQKNQANEKYKALEAQYSQMAEQLKALSQPKQPEAGKSEFDQLIADLKQVDPRLANALAAQMKSVEDSRALKDRLDKFEKESQEREQRQTIQTAVAKINTLHEANKVSPELKAFINNTLDLQYMQGKLKLENLEQAYKETYEGFKKYEDAIKRSERESYVKEKKADSNVPASQPKGTPAKPAPKKPVWNKDPEIARQQVVQKFLKQQAAEKDSSPV